MIHEVLLPILTLAVLIIASYTDLRTREVPDWLSYGFLFAVLGMRILFSIEAGWNILLEGLLGFAAFFFLAHLFYYTNQWGGGDSKLLMGLGASVGIALPFTLSSFRLLWYLLSVLFLGSLYGLGWMVFIAVKKRKLFTKDWNQHFHQRRSVHGILLAAALVVVLLSIFIHPAFLLLLFPAAVYYLLLFVNTVERSCFITNLPIQKVTEGDWLAEDVYVDGTKVMKKKTLQKSDLHALSLLQKQRKIEYVPIKGGVPFVPSFLFAYLVILFGSDVFGFLLALLTG